MAKSGGFDVVAITASSFGKDVAPRVAAKLGAGYAPDISAVKADGGKLSYKRPMFAGNAYGLCEITTPVQVVSVRQSEFTAAEPSGGASPVESVAAAPPDAAASRVEFLGLEAAKSERPDLGEAKVIVSGGRALKENFAEVLDPLADAARRRGRREPRRVRRGVRAGGAPGRSDRARRRARSSTSPSASAAPSSTSPA